MAGTLFTQPGVIPVNSSGTPYAGATLTFTQAGTSTPCDVYTTAALTTAAGVSGVVTADSAGYFEPVYLDQSTSYDYKCVLKDSGGSVLKTWDNIPRSRIPIWCGTAGGTADAITLTPSPAIASYVTGQTYRFLSGSANTGAVTVAISGLAAKSVKKQGATALAAGDIPASAIVDVTYDGSNLQVIGLSLAALPTLAGTQTFSGVNTFSGALTGTAMSYFYDLFARIVRLVQIDVASATDVAWQTTGSSWRITGTTTINTIATPNTAGTFLVLIFTASLTVNDDSTSAGNIQLAGGANFSATANDTLTLLWDGTASKWVEVCRSVN